MILLRTTVAMALCTSLCFGISQAKAADDIFPHLVPDKAGDTAPTVRLPGKIVTATLATPSLAKAKAFYGKLLGWKFSDIRHVHTPRAAAMKDGRLVALLIEHPAPSDGDSPVWLPVISVNDAHLTAEQSTMIGGKILFKDRTFPGFGAEAILEDPQGGDFAVLRSESGDPADSVVPEGVWNWSALLTPDPRAAAEFYGRLMGYQIETLDTHHYIVSAAGLPRASLNALPPRLPGQAAARWVRFINVLDVDARLDLARSLGGRVVVPAHDDRDGVRMAVVADPSGAVFGLMAWPGPSIKDATP